MPRPASRPNAEELVAELNRAGSVEGAAKALGVHRATVHDWLRELGIERGDWRLVETAEGVSSAT